MDSNRVDIYDIFRRFCDIKSGKAYDEERNGRDDETQSKFSREALAQLFKYVESSLHTRISVFDELQKLMSKLGTTVDCSEFSCFYEFVFFMCRENGQKNITISKAVAAWRLVLAGRFRLLNQWCKFVQANQQHNISEDTWLQVFAFSRCVHENLQGYDPEGAWPVLIDEFVEHMYRVLGSNKDVNLVCNCGDSESQSCALDEPLPGLKIAPGLKRKSSILEDEEMEISDIQAPDYSNPSHIQHPKRNRLMTDTNRSLILEGSPVDYSCGDCMEISKHSSPFGPPKSPCAVESCLSRGFAGLFSTRSYLPTS